MTIVVQLLSLPMYGQSITIDNLTYTVNGTGVSVTQAGYWNYNHTVFIKVSGDIIIPESVSISETDYPVTEIADNVFKDYTGVTSISLPEGLLTIGSNAFYGCVNMVTANIPSTVTTIKDHAFWGCRSWSDPLIIPAGVTEIGESAFSSCYEIPSITFQTTNLTSIGSHAFSVCKKLTEIEIPETVTSMGSGVFATSTALKYVKLPNGLKELPASTFLSCSALRNIKLPNSLTNIDESSFASSGIEQIVIPENVNKMKEVFYGCTNLSDVIFLGETPPQLNGTITHMFGSAVNIYVKFSSLSAYKTTYSNAGGTGGATLFKSNIPYASTVKYSTFSCEFDVDFSGCTKATVMTVTGNDDTNKSLLYNILSDGYVPAGEGVLIANVTQADDLSYTIGERTGVTIGTNYLKGVPEAATISPTEEGCTNYVLKNGVFRPFANPGVLGAHKAYLSLPNGGGLAHEYVIDSYCGVTIINEIDNKESKNNYVLYDVNGRQTTSHKKGLYLIGNKKVLIK